MLSYSSPVILTRYSDTIGGVYGTGFKGSTYMTGEQDVQPIQLSVCDTFNVRSSLDCLLITISVLC